MFHALKRHKFACDSLTIQHAFVGNPAGYDSLPLYRQARFSYSDNLCDISNDAFVDILANIAQTTASLDLSQLRFNFNSAEQINLLGTKLRHLTSLKYLKFGLLLLQLNTEFLKIVLDAITSDLEALDLSGSGLEYLSIASFKYVIEFLGRMQSLKYCNISGVNLHYMCSFFPGTDDLEDLLSAIARSCEVLDLSNTYLHHFSGELELYRINKFLSDLTSLQQLNLAENQLWRFDRQELQDFLTAVPCQSIDLTGTGIDLGAQYHFKKS